MHCTNTMLAQTLRAMHPNSSLSLPASPISQPSQPLRFSFAMLLLMLILSALDQTIVSTALPSIAKELQGAAQMSWVFSAYLIASTVAVPLYGKLADMYGTKPLLLTAVGLFLLGSALCGVSRQMDELILARGLQGAGGGGLLTLAMMSVVRVFPQPSRARLQGMLGAAYGLSIMVGPLVGGFLVEHLSWRWAFFINLPVGLLALGVLAAKFPRQRPEQGGSMDYLGAVLLAGALVSLLLSTRPAQAGALTWPAANFAVLGLALVLAFIGVQARSKSPLLPLTLFTQRGFSAATGLSASSGFTLFAVVVFMPLYFQTARGLSPANSGWHLMPLMAGVTLASIACGRILTATGRVRSIALAASGLSAVSFIALGWAVRDPQVWLGLISLCLFPLGMGIGTLFPLVTVMAQSSAPLPLMGIATASPVMFRTVAGAVGVSALGALFEGSMTSMLAQHLPDVTRQSAFGLALSGVFWSTAAVAVLACGAAWALPSRLARNA